MIGSFNLIHTVATLQSNQGFTIEVLPTFPIFLKD